MSDMRTELDRALRRAENPLATGTFCPECGCRLDSADRPCPLGCKPKGRVA